jgi:hypothetical protein
MDPGQRQGGMGPFDLTKLCEAWGQSYPGFCYFFSLGKFDFA